ncbi:hypothetical protein [Phenylobacterium sp.]|jgi:hypothetical protein
MLEPTAPPPPAPFAGLVAGMVRRDFPKAERAALAYGKATS